MTFKELHEQNHPLVIGNVWDVPSAQAYQEAGYQALGTSSAAIAAMLGYEDGQRMSFDELLFIVKRIQTRTSLPISVDIEAGYADNTAELISNIEELCELGIAGINIEDSLSAGVRGLLPIEVLQERMAAISAYIKENQIDLFLNARSDAFLLGLPNALEASKKRAAAYAEAGADGIFLPGIIDANDIAEFIADSTLPLNVMTLPGLPNYQKLITLGVKRISMGNFPQVAAQKYFAKMIETVVEDSFSSLLA
ncbi:MAG: isocitrate lyase/phosphoenolpyruvate mutase family protein [Calditrichota bacterium]